MSFQVSAEVTIHDGKMAEFMATATKCRSIVAEKEQKTNLLYDWFVRGRTCEVRETYTDSDAFLLHLSNVEEALGELLRLANLVVIRIYGEPSVEVMTALIGLPVEVYTPLY